MFLSLRHYDVDCLGLWGKWGECSAECGGGSRTREWKILRPQGGNGKVCQGFDGVALDNGDRDTENCNTQPCTSVHDEGSGARLVESGGGDGGGGGGGGSRGRGKRSKAPRGKAIDLAGNLYNT